MSPSEDEVLRSGTDLSDLSVLCVDCQTTGATPELGALLQLGWAVVPPEPAGTHATRAFWTEVPPPHCVSRIVRELTGYDDRCKAEAIPAGVAWSRLKEDASALLREAKRVPTVIHFARFELAFLRDLHERLSPNEPFPLDAVCLHEIARRLFPDLPRRSLRALAGYLGHSPELIRRSGGHVDATAFAWRALAGRLRDAGVTTWDELRSFLDERAPPRSSRRGFPITAEQRRALPSGPGVYRFVRSNGDVLYVGKAASLKKRVASHFGAGSKTTERALEMLTQAHDVVVTETASAVEAALLETDEIKRLDPPYNVHLKDGGRRAWFASRDGRLHAEEPSAEHSLGPFPSPMPIRGLAALVALLSGAEPTVRLRAGAVGVPEAFAPEEAMFRGAWSRFLAERAQGGRTPWGRFVRASARLRETEEPESDDTTEGWDEARVARHLERTLRSVGQLVRRGRIMTILSDANVTFREVAAPRARRLVIRRGAIVETLAAPPGSPAHDAPRPPWRDRQRAFDAGAYDRLRVLVTELVRVLDEGGEVAIGAAGALLAGERARRLLRSV